MRFGSYDIEDQVWIRDQTARILHRYVLAGKHFRIDVDALLLRVRWRRASIPASSCAPQVQRAVTQRLPQPS